MSVIQEMFYMYQKTIILHMNVMKYVIFYAAYPHDWKKKAGLTHVPGIDPEDMGIE